MIESIDCELCAISGEEDYNTLVQIKEELLKQFGPYHCGTEMTEVPTSLKMNFNKMPIVWFGKRESKLWGALCKLTTILFANVEVFFNCSDGTRQLMLHDEYFELLDKINTLQDEADDYYDDVYSISCEDLFCLTNQDVFEVFGDMCALPRETEYYLRQPHAHVADLIVEYPDFKKVLEGLDVRVQY